VGCVWPFFNGSSTFFVASLVLPSELTATCVLLALSGVISLAFDLSGSHLKKSSLPSSWLT
jgi:hypothetical protein